MGKTSEVLSHVMEMIYRLMDVKGIQPELLLAVLGSFIFGVIMGSTIQLQELKAIIDGVIEENRRLRDRLREIQALPGAGDLMYT